MSVNAAKPDRLATLVLHEVDEVFIHLARQNHLHDLHRFLIGYPKPVYKFRFFADLAEHFRNFRSAAVHEHDFDPDEG